MRRRVLATLLSAALLASSAWAQDAKSAGAPPKRRPTAGEAAAAVIGAVGRADDAELRALAARDDPDPWVVADELCARGEFDAADAFAKAAARPDVERLPEYVASQRRTPTDPALREVFVALARGVGVHEPSRALAAIDAAKPDGRNVTGVRLVCERGSILRALGRLEESAAAFRTAADAAEALGWPARVANSLHESGDSAYLRGDLRLALTTWEARVAVEERRGARLDLARALGNVALVHDDLGDHRRALEMQHRALELKEEFGTEADVGRSLANIGASHLELSQFAEALDFLERALRIKQALRDREGESLVLGNLGILHQRLGDHQKALGHQERVLAIARESGDAGAMLHGLGSLGVLHHELGEHHEALEFLDRALVLAMSRHDLTAHAWILANIGRTHTGIGNYAKALDFLERALILREQLGNAPGVAVTLGDLGWVHKKMGDVERALEFEERSLALAERLEDRPCIASALARIAAIRTQGGDHAAAADLQERALTIWAAVGDDTNVCTGLANLGIYRSLLGDHEEGLRLQERSLEIAERCGDRIGVAIAFMNIGHIQAELGHHERALEFAQRCLRIVEEGGSRSQHVAALAQVASYECLLDLDVEAARSARRAVEGMAGLVRGLGHDQGAKTHAANADIYAVGTEASVRLRDAAGVCFFLESGRAGSLLEMLSLRDRLCEVVVPDALRTLLDAARGEESAARKLLERASAAGDPDAVQRLRTRFRNAQSRLAEVVETIQRTAKDAADVTYPKADGLPAIQARLAVDETLVLFGAALETSVALVVTAKDARIVELGPTAGVEAACLELSLDGSAEETAARVAALRKVLVEPLVLGAATRRLLVSPDGAVSYVPFALVAPEYEVACVPSGTTYGVLRGEREKRGEGILSLGDPDYSVACGVPSVGSLRGGRQQTRLPATREEAATVGTDVLLGEDATESGLRAALAARPRWRSVHLACHGLIDAERPELSSLAITPEDDEDGYLTVLEVFQMKIPADLVVLSACETGKGKVLRGEGILGLTRAFMFAGAPRVLVSLWKVDDDATRALMVKFYELWNAGSAPVAALRDAQRHVAAQPKWKHPRFWAAWVLWGLPE